MSGVLVPNQATSGVIAPQQPPPPQKSKWDQLKELRKGGMDFFTAAAKVGMKKFGKNTWVDPETGRGLHINPSDLNYSAPGSIIQFYGWDRPEYRQKGLNQVTRVFDPSSDPSRDKRSKEQIAYFDSIKNGMGAYLKSIKTSWADATDQQKLDAYDFGLREHGRKTQTRGGGFFSEALGFVKSILPAVAGSLILPGVGTALGTSISSAAGGAIGGALSGGINDGLKGAALGGLTGYGTGSLVGKAGNYLSGLGGGFSNPEALGVTALGNTSNVAGDALFNTSLANQLATGSGVGAAGLGPTSALGGSLTSGLGSLGSLGLNPWTGSTSLPSGGFSNPGALSGTTTDQVLNTLNTTLPIDQIAPSLSDTSNIDPDLLKRIADIAASFGTTNAPTSSSAAGLSIKPEDLLAQQGLSPVAWQKLLTMFNA